MSSHLEMVAVAVAAADSAIAAHAQVKRIIDVEWVETICTGYSL